MCTDESPTKAKEPKTHRTWVPRKFPHLPALSVATQTLLFIVGFGLIVLGLVGLFTPGPGTLALLLGAAALSLVSRPILSALRFVFRPWPKLWRALLRARRRIFLRLTRGSKSPDEQRSKAQQQGESDGSG
ncbi:MAG: PGPGW domain-containing protein [Acidobacteriota bacterium]